MELISIDDAGLEVAGRSGFTGSESFAFCEEADAFETATLEDEASRLGSAEGEAEARFGVEEDVLLPVE